MSPNSFAAAQCAAVAPTLPAPTIVIFALFNISFASSLNSSSEKPKVHTISELGGEDKMEGGAQKTDHDRPSLPAREGRGIEMCLDLGQTCRRPGDLGRNFVDGKDVRVRLFRLLSLCLLVAASGGCGLLRRAPMVQEIGTGVEEHPGVMQIRNGPDRPEGLRRAFPGVGEFIASSRVRVTGRRFLIFKYQTQLDVSLISGDDASLRMVARHPGDATTVLDMMVAEGLMRVYLPLNGRAFQGKLPPEGSPMGARFGVEPWDLRPVFAIGQRLVELHPNWVKEESSRNAQSGYTLTPPDPAKAGGLLRVVLDAETGLPREADFARGKARWTAEYQGWSLYKNSEDDAEAWLMPSRMVVRNRKPSVTLDITIRQYRMNPPPDLRRWRLTVPPGTPMLTLEELGEGLRKL
jgi:hypothetical protein